MSNETIFIDFFQTLIQNLSLHLQVSRVWNFQSRLWACNARFFSSETIFNDYFQSLANFPAKGLLAREAPSLARYARLLGAGVLKDPSGNLSYLWFFFCKLSFYTVCPDCRIFARFWHFRLCFDFWQKLKSMTKSK